jgi:hypothetical protein
MVSRNEIAAVLIKLFFLVSMTNTPSFVAVMFLLLLAKDIPTSVISRRG